MHRICFALDWSPRERAQARQYFRHCGVDEPFVGGRPRPGAPRTVLPGYRKNSNKVPVVALVERGGKVRTKVVANVTQENVGHFLFDNIEKGTIVNTDQSVIYHTILHPITKHLGERHDIVNHSKREYSRHNAV